MKPLELAQTYMDMVFTGTDLDTLHQILDEDCTFEGPLFQSRSAEEYITALKTDPPKDCSYILIQSLEHESTACLFYQFTKPGVTTPMAHLFEARDNKIHKIILIFNTAAFP